LIVNPGAEILPLVGNGWTQTIINPLITPDVNWNGWTGSNASLGERAPYSGTYHFYAGDNSNDNYYLDQIVNVSAYASSIDAGTASFTFTYWYRGYNSFNDRAIVYLDYCDASLTSLSLYNSGTINNGSWTQRSDTRVAPIGTRSIRVRLFSLKESGSAADAYFDDLSLTTTATLPVNLSNFYAKPSSNSIQINWITFCEKDNDYFTLEKSTDGTNWDFLAKQKGSLLCITPRSYSATDANPTVGTNYYRLSQTDIDGTKTYFKVISCNFKTVQNSLQIYPNPSEQGDELVISSELVNPSINIIGQSGELIYSGPSDKINQLNLPAGVYFFSNTESNNFQKVIIK
jgi:hypothetical protein